LRRATAAPATAIALIVAAPLSASEENYFEWLAVAPVVVTGEITDAKDKSAGVRVAEVIRGELTPGAQIQVALRRANRERDRELHPRALEFAPGESWILLLEPESAGAERYDLVRGVSGARPLPAEGAAALVKALRAFVEIRRAGEDEAWTRMRAMLTATEALLVDTALQMHLKFRRGDLELIADLRPLLDHPEPAIRERTLRLIEQILSRHGEPPAPERERLQSEIVARARRDQRVEVRIAATEALDRLAGDSVLAVLDEIADDDPDQRVRYAAEARAYERRRRAPGEGPAH
jgi:hypothetical protein